MFAENKMEETQEIQEKPKRGRPRKVVEETALAVPEPDELDDPPFQPDKRRRKNRSRNSNSK